MRLEGPAGVEIGEIVVPVVGPHDVRVAVAYAAVNFMDLLITAGQYQFKPALPFVPGHDAAGEIIEVGAQVADFQPGDRVSIGVTLGAFAEQVVAPAARAVRLPECVDLRMAAAYRASYCTALYALRHRATLRPGENLIVTGAAGGVGLAALQIARVLGAAAIGVVGSEEKARVVATEGAGAIVAERYDGLRDAIRQQLPQGFDVALDTVGGPAMPELLSAAGWDSRILVIGFAGGIASIPSNRLLLKNSSVIGVNYGAAQDKDPATTAEIHTTLLAWIGDGRIVPRIAAEFTLAQTRDALELLARRTSAGKILIKVR